MLAERQNTSNKLNNWQKHDVPLTKTAPLTYIFVFLQILLEKVHLYSCLN